jgi:lipopolysaccharide transport system permease protein
MQDFDFKLFKRLVKTCLDLRLNFFLGKHEMISMFGATSLGSLWQPISLGVTVFGIGVIFGQLFSLPLERYLPFLCIGMIQWQFLTSVFNEMSCVFSIGTAHKDTRYDELIIFPLRIWSKHLFQMLFNLTILIIVLSCFQIGVDTGQFFVCLLGLMVFSILVLHIGLIFCLVGAFYTDFANIVRNFFQLMFFVTPVMWQPNNLKYSYVFELNPLYHLIEMVRSPLLNWEEFVVSNLIVILYY